MFVIISGMGILAFTTSIIVSAFTEKLDEMRILQSQQKTQRLKELYLVLGYSTMAQLVCARLSKHSTPIVIIDKNPDKVEQAQRDGFIAINADASQLKTYKDINLRHLDDIKAALCLVDDEVQNIYITLTLKAINPKMVVYSRANSRPLLDKLKRAGATYVIYAYESIGQMAKEYVGHKVVFDAINELITGHAKNQAHEILLKDDDVIVGKTRNSIDFDKIRMILLGVQRKDEGFIFNPKDDFVFQAHDVLIVICTIESLEHFYEVMLNTKRSKRDQ
jgi:voltage-gated potassium channel